MDTDFVSRYVTFPDPLAAFDEATAAVAPLLAAAESHPHPTMPYPGWSFDRLRCHIVELPDEFAAVVDGRPWAPRDGVELPKAFAATTERARTAFRRPGFLDTVAPTPIGRQPGSVLVQHVVNELVSHGWDLARALGRDLDLSEELVRRAHASWRAFFDDYGRPDVNFGPEQPAPPGAPVADQLAAYLGRSL